MKNVNTILKRLKVDLKAAFGDKIGDLILFGSYSRGDNTKYSDIDPTFRSKAAPNNIFLNCTYE